MEQKITKKSLINLLEDHFHFKGDFTAFRLKGDNGPRLELITSDNAKGWVFYAGGNNSLTYESDMRREQQKYQDVLGLNITKTIIAYSRKIAGFYWEKNDKNTKDKR
ncbi:MAG: hypothetical protein AABX30_00285 [Nanoarchaeota archaeon]